MRGVDDAVEARVRDLRQPREAVRARRRFVERIVAEPPRDPLGPSTQPILREWQRSEEHTSELQSLMRISYAVFCLKNKTTSHLNKRIPRITHNINNQTSTRH